MSAIGRYLVRRSLRHGLLAALALSAVAACSPAGAQAPRSADLAGPLPTNVPRGARLAVADQGQSLQALFAASGEARRLTAA